MRASNIVNHVIKKYPDWNYYNCDVLKSSFTCFSEDECIEFIRKFWQMSCKDLSEWSDDLSGKRIQHIVYLYFLGYYIYSRSQCVKEAIDKNIKQIVEQYNANTMVTFPYVWSLIVLCHDLLYGSQDEDIRMSGSELNNSKLFELSRISIPPFLQNYELIEHYLEYRAGCEHGINAGCNVFKSLTRIRAVMSKLEDTCLCWEESLDGIYSEISCVILAHNIWFLKENGEGNSERVNKYRDYQLDELLLKDDNDYKVALKEYPLLFLLYLADTIEPIKKYGDFNSLKKVQINVGDKEISVSTSLSCSCAQSFMQSAKDLNDWLTKTTFNNEKNKVIIPLK